jgi:hypothetical protein
MSLTDRVHSHQFLRQRVTAALVTRRLDPDELPLRHGIAGFWTSVVIALVILSGFGVQGAYHNAKAKPAEPRTSIVLQTSPTTHS